VTERGARTGLLYVAMMPELLKIQMWGISSQSSARPFKLLPKICAGKNA